FVRIKLICLGTLTRGKRFVHADAVENGVPCIHYGELYTHYGIYAETNKSFIREELRLKMRYAQKGDVIIVGAGENNIDIGIGVDWEGAEDIAVHDACYTYHIDKELALPRYISYYLRTDDYHKQIKKYVSEGKICSISADSIGKAEISFPTLVEQERIVGILDRFDALCNDIGTGLPAEIEARQKQYEYYRDTLLHFKKLDK
ncbi:restriction endonuclease subunit S, partial [uncultured Megasphaera sp.]|uniref:restriction endonuclease subunit S n=1 Tax=uncultured Megasphaera sp. TaxID=165188 RepID=UPI002592C5AC